MGEDVWKALILAAALMVVASTTVVSIAWYNVTWLREGYCQQVAMGHASFAAVKCAQLPPRAARDF